MLVPEGSFWQIEMDEASKQYTTFTVGNLGFLSANACCSSSVMTQLHVKG